ncbi:hypothetical protein AAFP30_22355 [Gordonia sp. CPCC 205515]|uniref:hypothetical protein n=1 Tax=Gordonia sp. CPCC 205515 TaxID=3140791 RepID=UPI003AF3CC81
MTAPPPRPRAVEWHDTAQAFALVAQRLHPVDGGLDGVQFSTYDDAMCALAVLTAYAADWLQATEPGQEAHVLAQQLRDSANLIREVDDIEPQGL